MPYNPGFQTYNEHYLTIDYYFGLHEHMTCTKISFKKAVKTALDLPTNEGYLDIPEKVWTNATYEGNKIVRMFWKHNSAITLNSSIVIITRNEKSK